MGCFSGRIYELKKGKEQTAPALRGGGKGWEEKIMRDFNNLQTTKFCIQLVLISFALQTKAETIWQKIYPQKGCMV